MSLYPDFETRISYEYLKKVINVLDEPVCIFGGWAVFLTCQKNFKARTGANYPGSKDIDLGFFLDEHSTEKQLKNTSLAKAIKVLMEELDFQPVGFRLFKDFNSLQEKEVSKEEAKQIPASFHHPLYVDLGVSKIPKNFKKVFGFDPIDEPLLELVQKNHDKRTELKEFNKKLLLPSPDVLIATKINAVKNRSLQTKRVKDIIDIAGLIMFSPKTIDTLRKELYEILSYDKVVKIVKNFKEEELGQASNILGIPLEEIKANLNALIRKTQTN